MGIPVTATAAMSCSFGAAPSTLNVIPTNKVMMENKPAATIMDNKPFVNILPFGVCMSLANPITAAQTAAALGVLTPGVCTPMTTAPWMPGSPTVMIGNVPALNNSSTCMCAYGGVISVSFPGATTEQIP
ncbi:DUF4280 domain-containing protein [Ilumatobacter coccineus]|jgi:Domain of unknown function (DUF4280)|uniref:DUF4280 domain-containing protein n=1 Tax=Ilumatobacter coccineus (strain NBRC 103263 / KCTC 29153 / YM16-304) TaxID=1313172 RepID=A0A6C7EF70_ILUCY|nr:DUF4280 domain-containing protein [Ilumatobacter coccineus]BAN02616.1 hypothetical protein YM304_23020 [Ilumatobacter coccineus YM16-304]